MHQLGDLRQTEPGVLPHRHRRRAGVRLLAGQRDLQPPQPLAVGDHADIDALGLEDRPLLDVQLEERLHLPPAHRLRRPSSRSAPARRRTQPLGVGPGIRPVEVVHAREDARSPASRARTASPPRWSSWSPRSDGGCGCRGRPASGSPPAPPARRARRRTCRRSAGCRDGCRRRPAARRAPLPRAARTSCPSRRRPSLSPAASHQRRNSARPSASASVRVWRLLPPATPGPIFAISMRQSHSRAPSILRFSPGASIAGPFRAKSRAARRADRVPVRSIDRGWPRPRSSGSCARPENRCTRPGLRLCCWRGIAGPRRPRQKTRIISGRMTCLDSRWLPLPAFCCSAS